MEFRTGRGACYASNIVHTLFVIHLFRPWATRGMGIDENGLRAVLGLNLPSKGPCIKDKSFDLVFILDSGCFLVEGKE